MHGLRCDPALLGWTRLLDEWVVGLMHDGTSNGREPIGWGDRASTLRTFTDAATRVRSFAFPEEATEPTVALGDGSLRFELQGRTYRVVADQQWPGSSGHLAAEAKGWLADTLERAVRSANEGELPIAAVFLTPSIHSSSERQSGARRGEAYVDVARHVICSGCAFSFPGRGDPRYRHGDDEYPGALLLIQSAD